MEVYFEYQIENGQVSDGEYQTYADCYAAAEEAFQEACDDGDYEYGVGIVNIYVLNSDGSGVILISNDIAIYSEYEVSEKPYLQSEFI